MICVGKPLVWRSCSCEKLFGRTKFGRAVEQNVKKIVFENFLNSNISMKLQRISTTEVSLDSSCREQSNDISHVGFWSKIKKQLFWGKKSPFCNFRGLYWGNGGSYRKTEPGFGFSAKNCIWELNLKI